MESTSEQVKDVRQAKGRFGPGNNIAVKNKGQKKASTLIKAQVALLPQVTDLEALKQKVLDNWIYLLHSSNDNVRLMATKEISKYLFAQKSDIHETVDSNIQVNFNLGGEEIPSPNPDDPLTPQVQWGP